MSNILIVDDKEYNRKAFQLALEDSKIGANIYLANNENEANAILESQQIDLIITDLVMLNETSAE